MNKPIIHLDVVCYEEEDLWVAHCLQLDLVTTAGTAHQACLDMEDVIKAHLKYAIENNNAENLFKPAPPEVWRLIYNARIFEDRSKELLSTSLSPHQVEIQTLCA